MSQWKGSKKKSWAPALGSRKKKINGGLKKIEKPADPDRKEKIRAGKTSGRASRAKKKKLVGNMESDIIDCSKNPKPD